jgi:hypothetical protein
MPSSRLLRHVALVCTGGSEERNATIIKMTRIGEVGTTLAVTSNMVFLCSVRRLLVMLTLFPLTNSCHPDDGGDMFLRNIGS